MIFVQSTLPFVLLGFLHMVHCQWQIWDIVRCAVAFEIYPEYRPRVPCLRFPQWQTTWDRKMLLTYFQPDPGPINFVTPGPIGSADIVINDTALYQTIYGFGAALTDSSALLLYNLKTENSGNYWSLMDYLFNATDGANSAGFSFIRVPLGATDFSARNYSYDDVSGDTPLYDFNIGVTPSYVFTVLRDILSINNMLRVYILPWSPPGWLKESGTMDVPINQYDSGKLPS